MSMNIATAIRTLQRRQAHLLTRIVPNKYKNNHDAKENTAISVILFHIRKLEAENHELLNPMTIEDLKDCITTIKKEDLIENIINS